MQSGQAYLFTKLIRLTDKMAVDCRRLMCEVMESWGLTLLGTSLTVAVCNSSYKFIIASNGYWKVCTCSLAV
jgi:hypothetical protein